MLELPDRQKRLIRRRRFGSTLTAPPVDGANNTWVWDPDGATVASQAVVGPSGTLATPVKTAGSPSFYTFGSTDNIGFGNALSSTWANPLGFTFYFCFKPSSADLAVANSPVIGKVDGAGTVGAEFLVLTGSNQINFFAVYGGSAFTAYTLYKSAVSSLVAGTRYVVAVTHDTTQPVGGGGRTTRAVIYLNGAVSSAGAGTAVGTEGLITATTQPLRLGQTAGAVAPPSVISYASAYNGVHSAGTVAAITSWYQNVKGWK